MEKRYNASCVALGNFDGIHIGHDTLIKRMIQIGHETNQDSIIVTFRFVKKDMKKSQKNLKYINSTNRKIEILKRYNVKDIVEIELDEVISKYSPEQFIKEILVEKLNAKNIVVGYNFLFGYMAKGNVNTLREFSEKYKYTVEEIKPVKYNGITVSSTIVRDLIKKGKIEDVNNILVENYTIYNDEISIDFEKNIGYIKNSNNIVVPADGRYKVFINYNIDESYNLYKYNMEIKKREAVYDIVDNEKYNMQKTNEFVEMTVNIMSNKDEHMLMFDKKIERCANIVFK